ncbi:Pyridoxamine kinase [uncultured Alphaproteobacteria bacterium]|uniref:pyridoxal kinase n=1 Tax=uncultured Alphaproteobacteria bacterium TaxID=91750 RepID=A0A212K128_9PROT|nr:Pyridoxamine kinase [uncultured Alphaproteobacteria bacterium]
MSILSIQSHVAFGHVGNAAAVFPLQLMGHEVWPIHTVQFSNHTGYGAWTGQVFDAAIIGELLRGISERGALPGCRAVLSGYMGSAATIRQVAQAVATVRAASPGALYCCDPVMGDVGRGVFVQPGIPELMIETAVPLADIVTPNQFELEMITGRKIASLGEGIAAARAVIAMGPKVVVVTSLVTPDAPAEDIRVLAVTPEAAWTVTTPLLAFPTPLNGAGDALAALFLGHTLKGLAVPDALSATVSGLFQLFADTQAAQTRELQLVATGAKLLAPARTFPAVTVG